MARAMRIATIIRPVEDAPPLDSCYRFDHGDERFAGVVDDVVRIGEHAVEITLSMTGAEHERLLAVRP
jgi:hypothetical protein